MNKRDLIEYLKAELAFVEAGGYEQPPGAPWRAALVFEDSPSCLNFHPGVPERPCSECPLANFVPEQHMGEEVPCRFIPMDAQGQTLDSLYRTATKEETLKVVREWLSRTISELEIELRAKAG
jgi:hypothetical protein